MLPDIQPGNTKILYFFNCLLDGMHTRILAISGFNIPLHKIRSTIKADARINPLFLVFGISSNTIVNKIHTIPALPSFVMLLINMSNNGVLIF